MASPIGPLRRRIRFLQLRAVHVVGSYKDDGRLPEWLVSTNELGRFKATHSRHQNIEQNYGELDGLRPLDRFLA